MRRHDDEASAMTPADRLRALGRVLATGFLRLDAGVGLPPAGGDPGPKILPDSAANCLELPVETRLSVHDG